MSITVFFYISSSLPRSRKYSAAEKEDGKREAEIVEAERRLPACFIDHLWYPSSRFLASFGHR
jgi:hypothetical protein